MTMALLPCNSFLEGETCSPILNLATGKLGVTEIKAVLALAVGTRAAPEPIKNLRRVLDFLLEAIMGG